MFNWILFFFISRFRQIKQQYDLKVHEAELVQARLKQSTHHHQLEEVEALQKTVGKLSVQNGKERIIAWKFAANFREERIIIWKFAANFREELIIVWKFAAKFREERITCIVYKFARIQTIGINQLIKIITKLQRKISEMSLHTKLPRNAMNFLKIHLHYMYCSPNMKLQCTVVIAKMYYFEVQMNPYLLNFPITWSTCKSFLSWQKSPFSFLYV